MVEASTSVKKDDKNPSKLALFLRFTRIQFIPLIILPAIVGTLIAYTNDARINFEFLGLVILGVVLLHLGANAIDDCYDYENGVDQLANSMFPKDFAGWKPIPRKYLSLKSGKTISLALFGSSLAIGAYFGFVVGPWAFFLGLLGFLLAFYYCAPPVKLDYRGLGLGELAIFFCFGPIPMLGAYYVETGNLTLQALLVSIPIGIMTVTVLIDHDLIFYEVYSRARKYSLTTILGRRNSLIASLVLTAASFGIVGLLILVRFLPVWCFFAPIASAIVLLRKKSTYFEPEQPPPSYVSFTVNGLAANWIFSLVLALTIFLAH
jgi:1,4-dihydroxy-2-naphthoate octaprenyltransferase